MSTFTDAERDAQDLAKLVNEDTDVNTRYGTNPKKSAPKAIREFEEKGDLALKNSNFTDAGFDFATGGTIETYNQLVKDASGNSWQWQGALPHAVTAGTVPNSPDYEQRTFNEAANVSTKTSGSAQDFIDSFALKIFQSPTDGGLTEIQTRTINGGEVYEVRKVSDDSLATIYSDADGTNEIVQDGTSNVSGSDGVVEFYITDGDYYVEAGGSKNNFRAGLSSALVVGSTISYYNEGGNSAVENMVLGVSNGVIVKASVGDECTTGSGRWRRVSDASETLDDFISLSPVYYSDFSLVVDDNSYDNVPTLSLIHEVANRSKKPVIGDVGGSYINIGLLDTIGISIETPCDFSGCKFRLSSQTSPDTLYSQRKLFSCESEKIATLYDSDVDLSEFLEGATHIPSLGYENVVAAVYGNEKFLERNGDPSQPIYKQELCAVFENGALTMPLQFSYGSLLRIDIYKLETERLEIKNLQFIMEDDFKSAVGLYVQRNNTDVNGVSIEELDNTYKGYSRNFIGLFNSYNSVISNLVGNGFETGGGTYLIRPELTESCEMRNINAVNGWGVFGGNFNKNIKYIDCEVNRIDQHALGEDCVVHRCNIYGNSGIAVTGKGKLTITDCNYYVKANGLNLITLRSDYASIWDGEITLKNTKVVLSLANPAQAEVGVNVIEASVLNVDFGTDHVFPDVFVEDMVIQTDAGATLVTCYNLPSNTGVNDQYLPSIAKFHNISSDTDNLRVRGAPSIVSDQPKYKGSGMKFDLKNLYNSYDWVHSSSYDITSTRRDATLCFTGSNYSTGTPFPFSAVISDCDNCSFVWTLPTPLKVLNSNGIAGMLTIAGNGSGLNFSGVENSIFIYNSSCELMNYRGSQEFMIEGVNARSLQFIKPSYNSETSGYSNVKLSTMKSAQGCVINTDCPVFAGDEPLVEQVFTGVKSSSWT